MGPQPMWRRSLHDEYGYFDPEYITSGDYEFWLRISQTYDFYHIDQFLGLYLRSPLSIEHQNTNHQKIENKKICDKYRALVRNPLSHNFDELQKPPYSSNIRVSAIISAYNSEGFMHERLNNLIEQSLYRKGCLEIIVIDSNSSQNEKIIVDEFCKQYDNIHYLRTSERETVYAAWNRGILLAQGTYFVNANTDDRFAEDALEHMADILDNNRYYDAVYGNWLVTEVPNDSLGSETPKSLFVYQRGK